MGDCTPLLRLCANCGRVSPKSGVMKACGRCKAVRYCSRDCQTEHWAAHKAGCKAVANNVKAMGKDDKLGNQMARWVERCGIALAQEASVLLEADRDPDAFKKGALLLNVEIESRRKIIKEVCVVDRAEEGDPLWPAFKAFDAFLSVAAHPEERKVLVMMRYGDTVTPCPVCFAAKQDKLNEHVARTTKRDAALRIAAVMNACAP